MRSGNGFTLIELIVVITIIAILAAITIPSILRSRMTANETSARSSLDLIVKMNTMFRENDEDDNGKTDYWTENVWGMWGVTVGRTPIKLISRTLARSDYEGVEDQSNINSSGIVAIDTADGTFTSPGDEKPKNGYYVSMFTGRSRSGTGCNSFSASDDCFDDGDAGGQGATCSSGGKKQFTNPHGFGVMAFPSVYEKTGVRAFVADESGDVYNTDARSTDHINRAFNGSNGTPNRSGAGQAPVECLPDDTILGTEWGGGK